MATFEDIKYQAERLNADLQISNTSSCITVSMPQTKKQAKMGIAFDFIATSCQNSQQYNIDEVYKFMRDWEEYWSLQSRITNKMIKDYIRNRLNTDNKQAQRALLIIYKYQTAEEQNVERTELSNGVGFTGHDAPFLSSLAKQVEDRIRIDPCRKSGLYLSDAQFSKLRPLIKKYWKQLKNIMFENRESELKLLKLVDAANPSQQLRMNI